LFSFAAAFRGVLNVPSAGTVSFEITSDDAFVFGVGGGAARVSGPLVNSPAQTTFASLPVMGAVNTRQAPTLSTVVVNFPAAGAYPYELDYAKGGDKELTLTMTANGQAIPPAALLSLSPVAPVPAQVGQIQQLQLTAVDASGMALSGLPVGFTVSGVNGQSRTLVTDGAGKTHFAYAGSTFLPGIDTVQAAMRVGNVDVLSNAVPIRWHSGTNQAPVVSAGNPVTVVFPSPGALNGSVSDDGLPSNAVSVSWTMVSGPGTVTFDNAAQAVTGAVFSAPGSYVLRLTASDGALSSNATVNVTVNNSAGWSGGWLESPLDGSTVSGLVPVRLVSGITLTSGVLSYYPANDQTAVTVITNAASGSGVIAQFDTTVLNNGGYFVQLNGTNSAGVTQSNLALVTVAGEYKPGRVTATVTDFTVPSAGLAIQVQRTYDSLWKSQRGDFGFGWRLGLNAVNLAVSANGDVTLTVNGSRKTFYFTPQPNAIFQSYFQPVYTGEPGFFGSLVTTGDNCTGVLLRMGNIYQCALANAGAVYAAAGYKYRDPYGREYTLTPGGTLQSLKDLNGNELTLTASGITSSSGLNVPFVRDGQGRITQITDTAGNVYRYTYNAAGDLVTVQAPVSAPGVTPAVTLTTTYGYDARHLLTSELDPKGGTGTTTYYPDGKVQSVTDAAGQVTAYSYNLATRTTTVTNPDGGTVVTVNDAYGMPLSVTDGLGRTTSYTYDVRHQRLTETNALNQTTTYTYDAGGHRTSLRDPLTNTNAATYNPAGGPVTVTNPLGHVHNVEYDATSNITRIADSLGQVASFTYNVQGLALTMRDARGNESSYQYDAFGNRTRVTDPLGRVTQTVYDNMGRVTTVTDPRGNATVTAYDAFGRTMSVRDALNNVTAFTYDGNGNKISETDALGRVTTFVYDAVNRMTSTGYPDGTTKSWTYDFRGNKLTETDQLGRLTRWTYDLAGQLTTTTYADGAIERMTYDLAGRKLTQVDGRGNVTTYGYDVAGRMTSLRDAVGHATTYAFDAKGQRTSVLDAKGRLTTYTYDARGRQLTVVAPDGSSTAKGYDGLGLHISATDEQGRVTQYLYDAGSQLTRVTDALNQQTLYAYDLAGNKISQTDALGRVTTYTFDALNRRTSRRLPLGQVERMTYDAVGNGVTKTDFNGKVTTYAFDSLNRLLSKTPDASFTGAPPVAFTYTGTGRRATMSDVSGVTSYGYDARDRMVLKATPQGSLTYVFDLAGNVLSVVSSNQNGTNTGYAYDANNRLSGVTDNAGGGTTSYAYDATNQMVSATYPNGVVHANTFDTRDRVTALAVSRAGTAIASYAQAFRATSHRSGVVENTGRATSYAYDPIYRLTSETIAGNSNALLNGALTYGLDEVGNRLSLISTLAAISAQSFSYDANDRLSTDTYDANGNTVASGGKAFGYEFEDRLTSYDNGAVAYTYDGDGNRVARTVTGSTVRYLVDEQNPTGYVQVAEEVAAGLVIAQYVHGPQRISLRQSVSGTWGKSYYGYDVFGTTRALLDGAGVVTDTWAFDGFGNVVDRTGSTPNRYLYRGEALDVATGMYYLRARWYRSELGRLFTGDKLCALPCNLSILDIPIHVYVYADSDPVNRIDPTGFKAFFTYAELRRVIAGTKLQAHHILEQRFAAILVTAGCILDLASSMPLTKDEHRVYTNAWRSRFPYGRGTACATADQVIAFAREVYKDNKEIIKWLEGAFKDGK
jgi:RHS repeat-associated protein